MEALEDEHVVAAVVVGEGEEGRQVLVQGGEARARGGVLVDDDVVDLVREGPLPDLAFLGQGGEGGPGGDEGALEGGGAAGGWGRGGGEEVALGVEEGVGG